MFGLKLQKPWLRCGPKWRRAFGRCWNGFIKVLSGESICLYKVWFRVWAGPECASVSTSQRERCKAYLSPGLCNDSDETSLNKPWSQPTIYAIKRLNTYTSTFSSDLPVKKDTSAVLKKKNVNGEDDCKDVDWRLWILQDDNLRFPRNFTHMGYKASWQC